MPLLPKDASEEEDGEEVAGRDRGGAALLGPYLPSWRRAKVPLRAGAAPFRRRKSGATHLILALSAVVRDGLASTGSLMRDLYQLLTNQVSVALSGPATAMT